LGAAQVIAPLAEIAPALCDLTRRGRGEKK
jgi:hypothetical protein